MYDIKPYSYISGNVPISVSNNDQLIDFIVV